MSLKSLNYENFQEAYLRNKIYDNNLTDKQFKKLIKHLNRFYQQNKADSREELLKIIKEKYNVKSEAYLKFFLLNISQGYNKRTKSKILNNEAFKKYINNFEYTKKASVIEATKPEDLEYSIKEKQPGSYLDNQKNIQAHKHYAKINYIDYYNKDKQKHFITITLPSKYHKYKKTKTGFKLNKNYEFNNIDFETQISANLNLLNVIYRYFYKQLDKEIKREAERKNLSEEAKIIDKIKILEPHKSLTPHLHFMVFVDPEFEHIVNRIYNNVIKKFNLENEFCKIEKVETAKASTYIAKYIIKTLSDNEEDYNNIVRRYISYFSNVRFFKTSNFRHTTQKEIDIAYSYLNKNHKEYLNYLKTLKTPLYVSIEQLIKDKVFIFEYEEKEQITLNYTKIEEETDKRYLEYIEKNNSNSKKLNEYEKIKNILDSTTEKEFDYLEHKNIINYIQSIKLNEEFITFYNLKLFIKEDIEKLKREIDLKNGFLKKLYISTAQKLKEYKQTTIVKTLKRVYFRREIVINSKEIEEVKNLGFKADKQLIRAYEYELIKDKNDIELIKVNCEYFEELEDSLID